MRQVLTHSAEVLQRAVLTSESLLRLQIRLRGKLISIKCIEEAQSGNSEFAIKRSPQLVELLKI